MNEVERRLDDEIDLIEIIRILIAGKWKIMGFVAISLISILIYIKLIQGPPVFTMTTEIRKINSVAAERYSTLKEYLFIDVSSEKLLEFYIDHLENSKVFEQVLYEDHFIGSKDKYIDEETYLDAIIELSSKIKIVNPSISTNSDGVESDGTLSHWKIIFNHRNTEKWKNALNKIDKLNNKLIKDNFILKFNTSIAKLELEKKFELEDIQTKIDNAIIDYNTLTENRLEYLKEQSAIARELGLELNSVENQLFSGLSIDIESASVVPYYLRGYIVIDKEIDLIKTRLNTTAFTEDIFELESMKRQLAQDKKIERARNIFDNMVIKDDNFNIASLSIASTQFENNQNSTVLILALTTLLSGLTSGIYVYIISAIRNRKVQF